MEDLLEQFEYRRSLVQGMHFAEADARLKGFYEWLRDQEEIRAILEELTASVNATTLLEGSGGNTPPQTSTPEEVAAVGVAIMDQIAKGEQLLQLGRRYGIRPPHKNPSVQDQLEGLVERFIEPAIDYLYRKLAALSSQLEQGADVAHLAQRGDYPPEITESLKRFLRDHPNIQRNGFIMMRFGDTEAHRAIVASIRNILSKYGIEAFRADDKQYHDDLFPNVLTYVYGCRFGIAVFERLEQEDFNPNVSLEVGYMRALRKPVCLLKDRTLKTLQTDLVGKLYKSFDPQDPKTTIPLELEKWLQNKDIITM